MPGEPDRPAAHQNERAADSAGRPRVLFTYWGRQGLSRFVANLVAALPQVACGETALLLSRQNRELTRSFEQSGVRLLLVDTFAGHHGALTQSWRIPFVRRMLATWLTSERIDVVIDLMPHVWSPLIVSAIQGSGARYVCVVHDAGGHPGDWSGLVTRHLLKAAYRADHVIALSHAVGDRLLAGGRLQPERLTVLFHPELEFAGTPRRRVAPVPGQPLRLLFLGRILAYKGLPLFLDMVARLRAEGVPVSPGIFGEGGIAPHAARIAGMGGEVINRRLSDAEVADVLLRYDALVACHVEASQSGVVAAALGAGLPAIVTPVGGLVEQVIDGETGIIAEDVTAQALAAAVRRLFFTPNLYSVIGANIQHRSPERSMSGFLSKCLRVAAGPQASPMRSCQEPPL